ncbi:unnamed protein product [Ambrosiozyma monospora]|uniref:Unnamed protein product n=1 Tax=Ambrosiozyma monospora TaxID=43982 RepID=A0A9W6Z1H2_AMBMO|nr:unnamed protein product [Ambrosiozyma monospora]
MVQESELTVSIMSHDSGAEEVLLCKNAKEKVVVRYFDNNNKPKSAILDSGAEMIDQSFMVMNEDKKKYFIITNWLLCTFKDLEEIYKSEEYSL